MNAGLITAATGLTSPWSLNVAIIMIVCNLFAVAIGRFAIQKRGVGPALPVNVPGLFEGFGWAELLATASLGHILGAGIILGLGGTGAL
ncbi:photosystem I reaction center subunit PsaK [Baaleninema simplex]|uniref:photosystem I reaction center subunit PsaK n=1 Tax=Baaleninema simplex TaxID=2862350 RepID=UPI00037A8DF2|nr:photosystem I reaction center subunit PsaK [Baaleninema simplex]